MDIINNLQQVDILGMTSPMRKTDSSNSCVPGFPGITRAIPQAVQATALHRGGAH